MDLVIQGFLEFFRKNKLTRFVVEVAKAVAEKIGKEKTGIRLSPYGVYNDLFPFPETELEYSYLAEKLNEIGIAYIHLVNHSSMGAPTVEPSTVQKIRDNFKNALILSGEYDRAKAEKDLESGLANLIAFGKAFLANPDLVKRLEVGATIAPPKMESFYTPDAVGYTDYPTMEAVLT